MRAFDLGSSPPRVLPRVDHARQSPTLPSVSGPGPGGSGREVVDARIKSIVFDRTYSVE